MRCYTFAFLPFRRGVWVPALRGAPGVAVRDVRHDEPVALEDGAARAGRAHRQQEAGLQPVPGRLRHGRLQAAALQDQAQPRPHRQGDRRPRQPELTS